MNILQTLDDLQIAYQKHDHPAVFTCDEAEALVPDLPAAHTKNLFLRDKKGKRHLLVVVGYNKAVDIGLLAKSLDVSKLSFASAERLNTYLGIEPGSVSLLALANDSQVAVELIIDAEIWAAEAIQAHPLINTSTLVISHADLEKFLKHTGHTPLVIDVPARVSE